MAQVFKLIPDFPYTEILKGIRMDKHIGDYVSSAIWQLMNFKKAEVVEVIFKDSFGRPSRELCLLLMQSAPKKTAQTIIDSGNDYLGALKGNQSGLLKGVKANFKAQETIKQMNKGHGRIEKRTISISHDLADIPTFPLLFLLSLSSQLPSFN